MKLNLLASAILGLSTTAAMACDCTPDEPKPSKEPPAVSTPRTPDTNSPAIGPRVCAPDRPWWKGDSRWCPEPRVVSDDNAPLNKL